MEPPKSLLVKGNVRVEIVQGPEHSLDIESKNAADANSVKVSQHGDKLTIEGSSDEAIVHITTPHLKEITLQGDGQISITNTDQRFTDLKVDGLGSISLQGKGFHLRGETFGGGSIHAAECDLLNADVFNHGTGIIELGVSRSCRASTLGKGPIVLEARSGKENTDPDLADQPESMQRVGNLRLNVHDSGQITVTGKVRELFVDIREGATAGVNGSGLEAEGADLFTAHCEGNSIEVCVPEYGSVVTRREGTGKIEVLGNPAIKTFSYGSGYEGGIDYVRPAAIKESAGGHEPGPSIKA